MEEFSELKSARLLSIYARLLNGRVLKKALLAQEFGVTARSIQRDLESLRSFLSNEMLPQDVVYDRAAADARKADGPEQQRDSGRVQDPARKPLHAAG